MINVVCVKADGVYGAEYVNILFDSVCRNLGTDVKFKFWCVTNDATGLHEAIQTKPYPENLTGWWAKLYLFKQGLFPDWERIFYIDLTTVIVSGLDDIFNYDGSFAILRDFYRPEGLQSAFMSWVAGTHSYIWNDYVYSNYPSLEGGDQAWIEKEIRADKILPDHFEPDMWQDLYPDQFVSYKVHCDEYGIPKGARVVKFHGQPKPHEIKSGWVPKIWKEGGGSSLELAIEGNTKIDKIKDNVRYSLGEGLNVLDKAYSENGEHAVIVGGGPSINQFVSEIKRRSEEGQHIFALNHSWKWLEKRGIPVNGQIMLDARPENVEFVPPSGSEILRLYATQCDHRLINLSKNEFTLLWNAYLDDLPDSFTDKNMFWVGSGTSVGSRSIFLLYTMGYRNFHIYGYDSSYTEKESHAYEQKLNDGEKVMDVVIHGRTFKAAPWMITQSQEFLEVMEYMTGKGCQFTIHGDGLLPHMVKNCLTEKNIDGDLMCVDGVYWPSADEHCRISTYKTIGDIDEIINLVPVKRIAIQAGGNVGIWPKKMAEKFDAVYTFEPDTLNYKCLELNCKETNIIKHNAALGDKAGSIGILRDERNTGAHQVHGEGDIPVVTIDGLNLPACDLIQLDIEGYELFALQGARLTIGDYHPVIVVEHKPKLMEEYGVKAEAIAEFLAEFGYEAEMQLHRDLIFTTKKREMNNGTR